jgi:hypothetical protein
MPSDSGELLQQLTQAVAELEAGRCPPGCPGRASATEELVARICGSPWQTAEERAAAQQLVARLERSWWAEP